MQYIDPLTIGKVAGKIIEFYPDRYVYDGSPCILGVTENGEPWGSITVNLSYYHMYPDDGWIYLNHDLMPFKDEIVKALGTGKTKPIEYGLAKSISIELKPEIAKKLIDWTSKEY